MRKVAVALTAVMVVAVVLPRPPARAAGEPAGSLKIHMIGVGEYKPVESLTALKQALERGYRVAVTTSFGKGNKSLPDLDRLKGANVLVIFARRLALPDERRTSPRTDARTLTFPADHSQRNLP